jgi:hypothetical protein
MTLTITDLLDRWAAALAAAGASWEIQGAEIFRRDGKHFFFLPIFGFASLEDIPARPADYGTTAANRGQ